MLRNTWPALLLALFAATPAGAQMAQPDGWVAEGGRIVRPGDAPEPAGAVHPAIRADWIGECEHRLAAANRLPDPGAGYEGVCRAWLNYYERTGAAAQGYDFTYAIPVTLTTIEVPGNCPPPAIASPPRARLPHPSSPDKRVKLIRY